MSGSSTPSWGHFPFTFWFRLGPGSAHGFPAPAGHMDLHAYGEVHLGGDGFTTDARFHVPRIGKIEVLCGQDAVDGTFSIIFGGSNLTYFEVWAYQVARGTVGVGDPMDLSKRFDNPWTVRTDP